jgi:glycerol-3-phosphate dehydrogenase
VRGEELGKIARTHKIYRPHENAWVILGGKYTTFRVMASDLTKEICHHFRVPYNPNSTLSYLSKKVTILPFEKPPEFNQSLIESIVESEGVRTLEDLLKRRIGLFDSETLRGGMPISTFKREFKETLKKFQLI